MSSPARPSHPDPSNQEQILDPIQVNHPAQEQLHQSSNPSHPSPSMPSSPTQDRFIDHPPTPPTLRSRSGSGEVEVGSMNLDPGYLNDLPSLTPSKLASRSESESESESDSIPDRFSDDEDDDPVEAQERMVINNQTNHHSNQPTLTTTSRTTDTQSNQTLHLPHRTPASQNSSNNFGISHISLSEPGPIRSSKLNRKRSLSALVALRYRGGKADSEIGDEERGLLALDLDTYINSGEPEIPETRALPPSALFPTLSTTAIIQEGGGIGTMMMKMKKKKKGKNENTSGNDSTMNQNQDEEKEDQEEAEEEEDDDDDDDNEMMRCHHSNLQLLTPTPRSEWPFGGGTGPGKTSRGFIPGRPIHLSPNIDPIPSSTCSSSSITSNTTITPDH